MSNGVRSIKSGGSLTLLTVIVVVAVLYFARTVFIPLALAMLLAFLLGPLVNRVRRLGLGRVPSVAVVVLLTFTVLAVLATGMVFQMSELGQNLPEYQSNIRKKLESIRGSVLVKKASVLIRQVNTELSPPSTTTGGTPSADKPVPVEIRKDVVSPVEMLQKVVGSVFSGGLTAAVVIVFVLFMLVQRENLRDRVIRLAGESRVSLTTQLLDDAAKRVSRYLLAQLVVNAAFGACAAIGLLIIGVPNPLLWGMLAALLRYVPYLGIWIAAVGPIAVAFAVEPGWAKVPAVMGLYLGVDLLIYNFVEPLLYGSSTGISPIAILLAAVFWTWLWGAVGLLLATPLTVCAVSIGRFVPRLHFLSVILSDEEVLGPETRFYQRMLAMDLDEATEVAEEFVKGRSLKELFDEVIVPALRLAEDERHRGILDDARQKTFYQNTWLLIDDVSERAEELIDPEQKGEAGNGGAWRPENPASESVVVCMPARDEADAVAAQMLATLLSRRGVEASAVGAGLVSESVEAVAQRQGRIACVCAIPPAGYMHARYLCRRLQERLPQLKVVAVVLTSESVEALRQHRPRIIANAVVPSLSGALAEVVALLPVTEHSKRTKAA